MDVSTSTAILVTGLGLGGASSPSPWRSRQGPATILRVMPNATWQGPEEKAHAEYETKLAKQAGGRWRTVRIAVVSLVGSDASVCHKLSDIALGQLYCKSIHFIRAIVMFLDTHFQYNIYKQSRI